MTSTKATMFDRFAYRLIGVGLLLLTTERQVNLRRYFGRYWNIGCWTMHLFATVEQQMSDMPTEVDR